MYSYSNSKTSDFSHFSFFLAPHVRQAHCVQMNLLNAAKGKLFLLSYFFLSNITRGLNLSNVILSFSFSQFRLSLAFSFASVAYIKLKCVRVLCCNHVLHEEKHFLVVLKVICFAATEWFVQVLYSTDPYTVRRAWLAELRHNLKLVFSCHGLLSSCITPQSCNQLGGLGVFFVFFFIILTLFRLHTRHKIGLWDHTHISRLQKSFF